MSAHSLTILALGGLALAFAIADWTAAARGRPGVRTWTKPAVLILLIALAFALGLWDDLAGRWVIVGLILGLVGDVMLLDKSTTRFQLGLAAFLLGHIAYVIAFERLTDGSWPTWWWLSLLALAVCIVATRRVVPSAHRDGGFALSIPVAVYTVVIGAMLIVAFQTGEPLLAVGAAVFVASDSILAVDRFVRPLRQGDLAVMITYHVGQALIVFGTYEALASLPSPT